MKNYKVVLVDDNNTMHNLSDDIPTIRLVYRNGNIRINTSNEKIIDRINFIKNE